MSIEADPGLDMDSAFGRLRADSSFYAKVALRIQTKKGTLTPLELNRAQALITERIEAQKARTGRVRLLVLKARQEGVSTLCAARIMRGITLWGHQRGLVIADKDQRSADIFEIYERFYDNLPDALTPPKKAVRRSRELAFLSDSKVAVETAGDKDAGRGTTLHYLHASEFASWPYPEETFTAVMQTMPIDGGEAYIESTAQGVGNLFHRLWEAAEAGESEWLAIFLPWWIHAEYVSAVDDRERQFITDTADEWERVAQEQGIEWEGQRHKLTIEQLAWRRKIIAANFEGDPRLFRQEYPATAREAFLASGNLFFDSDALIDYEHVARKPDWRGTFIRSEDGFYRQKGDRGYFRLWGTHPTKDAHYVIAADTAEGKVVAARDASQIDAQAERGGRDFSVGQVIMCCEKVPYDMTDETGVKTRHYRWEPRREKVAILHGRMAPELFADHLDMLGRLFATWDVQGLRKRPALLAVERNHSSGQTVLRELRHRWEYPTLYWARVFNKRNEKTTALLGWVTSGETRQPMLDLLAQHIRDGKLTEPDPDTIREMFTFVRGDDGRPEAQEGLHDDRVISEAIALEMCSRHEHESPEASNRIPTYEVADTPTGV